ncbi:hydrolase [Crenobacter cavernae]|uniref:Hydrolase n=1 Tax=Crenobacter cavernae TaxID=2290923 RepID=A0A345Y314_9NEIS|nr:hydrolase [Crenobacter cavernae]AXK38316.1 hydrolase [Crenobacter cavernae]
MLMELERATLLVIDVQEKLVPAVHDADRLVARTRWLLEVAADLGLPTVISEQYPKGLGHTLPTLLDAAPGAQVVDKVHFSCVAGACLPDSLMARDQVIVCGMETHVCVLQTVLELRAAGKDVFVVADAVASRSVTDHELGLARMQGTGAQIVSREMVLFELLKSASHERFRHMSKTYLMGEQP